MLYSNWNLSFLEKRKKERKKEDSLGIIRYVKEWRWLIGGGRILVLLLWMNGWMGGWMDG